MAQDPPSPDLATLAARAISPPLVTHIYTADPSAHAFDGRIYIYPSHDVEAGIAENDLGDHYDMRDYHVLRMDSPLGAAVDCGVALRLEDVPWADRQLWAPDAACRDGRYYLYFPAKRRDGIFQIGVAESGRPDGPFVPDPEPIPGSYSIDPAAFADDDGNCYLYFGGIWGGQLQRYRDNRYDSAHEEPVGDAPALGPRVARLASDMRRFDESPREVDASGLPLRADDHARRFFEAPWVHKHDGRYYLSYSTGNTHLLCYAMAADPYGPFEFQGTILTPVVGWTTHHSICAFGDRWYLYYHDALLSGGVSNLRSVKVTELHHDAQGRIRSIDPYGA
jgi:hypothetical protein